MVISNLFRTKAKWQVSTNEKHCLTQTIHFHSKPVSRHIRLLRRRKRGSIVAGNMICFLIKEKRKHFFRKKNISKKFRNNFFFLEIKVFKILVITLLLRPG